MAAWAATGATLEVITAGPLSTIQDLGRPGLAALGVPRSGAADRNSLRRANLLVGNPPGTPALECTLTGPALLADGCDAVCAVTGAAAPVTVNGRPAPAQEPFTLRDGELLTVGPARAGARSYIAFAGGLVVDRVLGSAARDLLCGLGPAPLAPGQRLLIGQEPSPAPSPASLPPATQLSAEPTLRVVPGPDLEFFPPASVSALLGAPYTVSERSNRVGLRLLGPSLPTHGSDERTSAGLVHGALQVPAGGQPILMGPDHPTTGGYPVIAVLADGESDRAGQLRPGQRVRFALAVCSRPGAGG